MFLLYLFEFILILRIKKYNFDCIERAPTYRKGECADGNGGVVPKWKKKASKALDCFKGFVAMRKQDGASDLNIN